MECHETTIEGSSHENHSLVSRAQNPPLNTQAGSASKATGPCRDGLLIPSRRKHGKESIETCVRHENGANSLPGHRNHLHLWPKKLPETSVTPWGMELCWGPGPAHVPWFLETVEWEAGCLETMQRGAWLQPLIKILVSTTEQMVCEHLKSTSLWRTSY